MVVKVWREAFSVIWREEVMPRQWREGLIVNLLIGSSQIIIEGLRY